MLIEFEFEELPLHIETDGRTGLFADGIADIEYFKNGGWRVSAIKTQVAQYELGKVPTYSFAPPPKPIAQMIELALLQGAEWAPRIQDKVWAALRVVDLEDREFARAYGKTVAV